MFKFNVGDITNEGEIIAVLWVDPDGDVMYAVRSDKGYFTTEMEKWLELESDLEEDDEDEDEDEDYDEEDDETEKCYCPDCTFEENVEVEREEDNTIKITINLRK